MRRFTIIFIFTNLLLCSCEPTLVEVFEDTQKICQNNPTFNISIISKKNKIYLSNNKIENCNLEKENVKSDKKNNIRVTDEDTITCVLNLYKTLGDEFNNNKICILNFANFTSPGGGVTNGAKAQEEDICRCSTLYPMLIKNKEYYKAHENFCKENDKNEKVYYKYNNDILYSEDVIIIKNSNYKELSKIKEYNGKIVKVDVITCAAPYNREEIFSDEEIKEIHMERGERIIMSAIANDVNILILGAFGCGCFNNNPQSVAEAYKELLCNKKYYSFFKEIIFPIPTKFGKTSKKNFNTFEQEFSNLCSQKIN